MRPVVCLITDGHAAERGRAEALVPRIAAAARAGVHLVQVRELALDGRVLVHIVRESVGAVAGTRARIVVNDRLDVALAASAHGVHLRGTSMPARRVREVTPPGFLIGRSVHAYDEAMEEAAEGGLDYLLFGTVFETRSKPGRTAAGTGTLARVCGGTTLPVLAVGGMHAGRMAEVARTGAAGFAAIGLFADETVEGLQVIVRQASLAFDTLPHLP